MIRDTLMDA